MSEEVSVCLAPSLKFENNHSFRSHPSTEKDAGDNEIDH
jgi:hypothetical protein